MVDKLRKRVVTYTLLAVLLVLILLMGTLNIANYVVKDRAADAMLEFLAENGGAFPGPFGKDDMEPKGNPDGEGFHGGPGGLRPGMTEETPYETRFFTVDLNEDGSISSINTGRIAAVDSAKAVEMVEGAIAKGKTSGYDGNYKYLLSESEGKKTYIFVDCTRDLMSVRSFLKTSLLVSLIGFVAISILVYLLSPKMIKPVAESYAKQKEFITNAGHELKTPMSVIESCTEVIELQSGESKWTQGIKEQVKKLSNLTTHMVALAKMDEGEELAMEEVDLSSLVDKALEGFSLEAEQQGRVIEKNIESGISIKGNATLLTELVSILADNAIKYAAKSEPIKFSLTRNGNKIVFTEANAAEELTKGSQDRLFDRFYRGDTSHSSQLPGSGIGLSMAQSIVSAHGGTISAESPDGEHLIITAFV